MEETVSYRPSAIVKFLAGLVSYIFHPVFVPLYVIAFLVYIHPSYFAGFSEGQKIQTLIISAINLVGFPLLTVLLLRGLNFISSLYMRTQKDRIIPYIAIGIFFFWAYTVFKNQGMYPMILTSFVLGIFLASSMALLANIYLKVSMHAIGMGGWIGLFIIILLSNTMLMTWPLSLVLIIAGIVCTARLALGTHSNKEIYLGLLIGLISQFAAAWFLF